MRIKAAAKGWVLFFCVLMLGGLFGFTSSADNLVTVSYVGTADYDSANRVLDMVNEERSKVAGCTQLVSNKALQQEAMRRAMELAVYYSHTRPNGTECTSIMSDRGTSYGENIAIGYKSAEQVMDGWMNSEGHRKNILYTKYRQIGVGCFYHRGTYYWVQLFNNKTTKDTLVAGKRTTHFTAIVKESLLNLSFDSENISVKEKGTVSLSVVHKNKYNAGGRIYSVDTLLYADSQSFNWSGSGGITLNVNGQYANIVGTNTGAGMASMVKVTCGLIELSDSVTVEHDPGMLRCLEGQLCLSCGVQLQAAPGHKQMYSRTQCTDGLFCAREGCGVQIAPPGCTLRSPATCTTSGRCLICNKVMQEALGHNFTNATCVNYGTCSNCGTGGWKEGEHVWGEWKRVAKATTEYPEKQQRTCTLCYWGAEIRYVGEKLPSSGGSSLSASKKKVTSVKIKGKKELLAGKTTKLSISVSPSKASNKKVYWKTSNSKYATVSANGTVTAKAAGAGKTVKITATAADGSGKKDSHTITIKGAVKKIKLKASKTVKAGKKLKIKATVTVGKGGSKALKWSSSRKKYATVNSKGVVTAKKAGKGKYVTITAKAKDGSGKKASIKIKIR